MLELYADGKCQSLIRKIPFKNITEVEYEKQGPGKLQFSMTKNDDNGITFCADSVEATKEWIQYGVLLLTIPNYPIAKPPNEMFIGFIYSSLQVALLQLQIEFGWCGFFTKELEVFSN